MQSSHRLGFAPLAALGLLVLAGLPACSSRSPASRVLLIGVDGLEWSVLDPLLDEGRLPNLARLLERGVHGTLRTADPTVSPVIWTSIATGKPMERHGIRGFAFRRPDGTSELYKSVHRRCKAFWNILSDAGRRSVVIGWWTTYPAEAIRGRMISQYATTAQARTVWKGTLRHGVDGQTYPPELFDEIEPLLDEANAEGSRKFLEILGPIPRGLLSDSEKRFTSKLLSQSEWSLKADQVYFRAAERLLGESRDWDLFAVYFGFPDVAGHRFWRYWRPSEFAFPPSRGAASVFGRIVPGSVECADAWIGSLLDLAGEDADVVVLSDHGMHAYQPQRDFDAEADPDMGASISGHHFPADISPGVFIAAGPDIRRDSTPPGGRRAWKPVGSVYQVLPTILYLLGIPVGRDMEGGGEPMLRLLERGFVETHEVRRIATHEEEGWRPPVVLPARKAGEEEIRQRLENLGYLSGKQGWER